MDREKGMRREERGEERWETSEEGGVKEVGMDTLGRDEDWKE